MTDTHTGLAPMVPVWRPVLSNVGPGWHVELLSDGLGMWRVWYAAGRGAGESTHQSRRAAQAEYDRLLSEVQQ
ncbi:MAG: hypothetical protein CL489_06985 [Acidobacteria bacterium]|nr:hypothetical protein [Acidobacteriota bacterium]